MFYGRKYKISIETYRGIGITLDAELQINFVIQKRVIGFCQSAVITIYNLNPETESDILQNGNYLTLEAGYQDGPFGVIFKGFIRQPIRGKEDATTYFLKLVCLDGDILNLGICNFSVVAGQTIQQLASQIARSSSIPFDLRIDPDIGVGTIQRGFSYMGRPSDPLRSIALDNNATFYTEDGIANISKLSKAPPPVVPFLNAKSGLIGMPAQTDQGIQARCLIDPSIKLDTWFHLNNRSILLAEVEFGVPQTLLDLDGLYRVVGMVITGDTRGNDWYFDLEAISQTGSVPAMLADGGQNGM